jgi:flagellar hook-associated protein 3 FlgL
LNYQDEVLQQASDLITRSREIAEQMANETNSVEARQIVASEVWALRDQMVKLGNSVYQGRYVYGGADDDDPPFDVDLTTYTSFGTPSSQQRYAFDNFDPPPTITNPPQRLVVVDDVTSIRVSSTGDAVFSRAIAALESLGRALEGYRTDTVTPDYTALTFPADYGLQTQAIRESLDDLEVARSGDIDLERSSVAGRLHQLDMTKSVLAFGKEAAKTQLATLRDADTAEAATELSLAQTALQASYTVTSRMLSLTILDYI